MSYCWRGVSPLIGSGRWARSRNIYNETVVLASTHYGMARMRNAAAIRLAHISDIHITARPLGWRWADFFNKRLTTWINLHPLGRAQRFRFASAVMTALLAELCRWQPERVILSGDATALGFDAEMNRAAALLKVPRTQGQPEDGPTFFAGLAVPGNHDYCTRGAEQSGSFERRFASWQLGERVDGATYPFAQRVGPLWLIAVNSSVANRWSWDARGRVGEGQLRRLDALLQRLPAGRRILVTHYPVCLADGRPEKRWHGLRDLEDVVAVAQAGGVCLWLHGHRHNAYMQAQPEQAPFPVICAGSVTQEGAWSYGQYTIEGALLRGTVRAFDPATRCFQDRKTFELALRG